MFKQLKKIDLEDKKEMMHVDVHDLSLELVYTI